MARPNFGYTIAMLIAAVLTAACSPPVHSAGKPAQCSRAQLPSAHYANGDPVDLASPEGQAIIAAVLHSAPILKSLHLCGLELKTEAKLLRKS